MKQHSKVKSSAYSPTSVNRTSQDLLYANMSHHYRMLLNAKKRVDTSPPTLYRTYGSRSPHRSKTRRSNAGANAGGAPNLEGLTPSDLILIQQVAKNEVPLEQQTGYWERMQVPGQKPKCPGKEVCPGQSKCPAMMNCRKLRSHRSSSSKKTHDTTVKPTPSKQQKVKEDFIDRHIDCFMPGARHFEPRILKTTASSKIRVSESYHPPRRKEHLNLKEKRSKEMDSSDEYDLGENEEDVQKWKNQQVIELVQCDGVNKPCPMKTNGEWGMEKAQSNQKAATTEPSSKVSTGSRDSAYNGGTSSGAESRGPTPEQVRRVPPVFSGNCSTPDSGMVTKASYAPGCPAACNVSPSPAVCKMKPATSYLASATANQRNGNEDILYATFSHEITAEILKKGIYTDKGINAVIQRHIELHKSHLAIDKLQQEADNIRTQLGIQNEEGVQKHLQFAEEPQWRSDASRSVSKEFSDSLNSIAKEIEKKGSKNSWLCSSPKWTLPSDSDEKKMGEEGGACRSTSGKLDKMESTSGELEDSNSISDKLKGVYCTSSGKLVEGSIGEWEDSMKTSSGKMKNIKSGSGSDDYAPVSGAKSPKSSSMDDLNVAHHLPLQAPKYAPGRRTSLPNPGGKLFADASIEVKPSTNSAETQTDITGTQSLLDALIAVPLAKPRTILFDGGVVKMAGSDSNESVVSTGRLSTGCSTSESSFDSEQEVNAEGSGLPKSNKSREKVSFVDSGTNEAHQRRSSVDYRPVAKPRSATELSSSVSDTTLHFNYHSKLSELVAKRRSSVSHSVTPVHPRDKQVVSVKDKDRNKSLDYYNPFTKAYYNVDALTVNSNVGDSCAGIDNTKDNLSAAEDAATPSKLQLSNFHAVPSSITRRPEPNIQESKKKISKAVPLITPRSFRT